jgi:hypothetical protein
MSGSLFGMLTGSAGAGAGAEAGWAGILAKLMQGE